MIDPSIKIIFALVTSFNKLSKDGQFRVTALAKNVHRPSQEVYYIIVWEAIRRFIRSRIPINPKTSPDVPRHMEMVFTNLEDLLADIKLFTDFEKSFFNEVLSQNERPSKVRYRPVERRDGVLTQLSVIISRVDIDDTVKSMLFQIVLFTEVQSTIARNSPYSYRGEHRPDSLHAIHEFKKMISTHKNEFNLIPPFRLQEMLYCVLVDKQQLEGLIDLWNQKLRNKYGDLDYGIARGGQIPNYPNDSSPQNIFRKKGDFWEIRYDGGLISYINQIKGMKYIHILIQSQGTDIGVIEFLDKANEQGLIISSPHQTHDESDLEGNDTIPARVDIGVKMVDDRANEEYRGRLDQIEQILASPVSNTEQTRIDDLIDEKNAIESELAKVTNVKGKPRRVDDETDRVRKRLSGAIKRAYKKILKKDKMLYRHLKGSIIPGRVLRYKPNPHIHWET